MQVHVGDRLRELAKKKGLTQKQISEQMGKSAQTIHSMFGNKDVRFSTLVDFLTALEIPIEDAFPELSKKEGNVDLLHEIKHIQERVQIIERRLFRYEEEEPS